MFQRFNAPDSETESPEHDCKRRRLQSEGSESYYSESDGPRGSSSDSEPCRSLQPSGLLLSQLVSMNEGKVDGDPSIFAKQATDKERIKRVLKEPCCKKKCKRALAWKLVLRMVVYFWALPKVCQDNVLWSIQQKAGSTGDDVSDSESESNASKSTDKHKISWSIEGTGFIRVIRVSCCLIVATNQYLFLILYWAWHRKAIQFAGKAFLGFWASAPHGLCGRVRLSKGLTVVQLVTCQTSNNSWVAEG